MKRATVISAAAFMLAASALCLTTVTPAAAYGSSDRISDQAAREQLSELLANRMHGHQDLRDLIQDRLQEREALRDLLADRLRGREDLRELLAERGGGRGDLRELLAERGGDRDDLRERLADHIGNRGDHAGLSRRTAWSDAASFRDLIRDRLETRNDLRDLLGDRIRSREDLRDLLTDRMERRALLRELLAEHMNNRGGSAGDLVLNRSEGSDENPGGTAGINREDLRDLILDSVRNRGEVGQLLEQIHDRIAGEE